MHLLELVLFLRDQTDYLVELGGKQIQRSQDGTVGTKLISLHHVFVLDGVSDIDVAWEVDLEDRRIEINVVGFLASLADVAYQSLMKSVDQALTCTKVVLPDPAIPRTIRTIGAVWLTVACASTSILSV